MQFLTEAKLNYEHLKNKLTIIFLFITFAATAADSLVLKIDATASFFTTDHLQNIYYINEKYEIIKYEYDTKQQRTFSNKQLGKPTYIDVTNPLKILVLYPDLNTIVWLDNTMSAMQVLKLNQLPEGKNYLAGVMCKGADDNTFWIFDKLSNKLIQIDERGNTMMQSEVFTDMLPGTYIPKQLLFANETIYVNCVSNEILLFDVFANYVSAMDIESEGLLQIVDKKFIFLKSQMLYMTEGSLYWEAYHTLPRSGVLQVQVQGDKMFILTEKDISVYTEAQ
jgi:hypothetical protein